MTNQLSSYKKEYCVVNNRECSLCRTKKVHSMKYDTNIMIENTPIIRITPGKAIDNTNFYVCQHFIIEIEKCLKKHNYFSIVFDFEDYNFTKMISNMNIAYNLSSILQDCYNERLKYIYLVKPPGYISPMITMMQNIFHNSIYNKIKNI